MKIQSNPAAESGVNQPVENTPGLTVRPTLDLAEIKFDPSWALRFPPSLMIRRRFLPLVVLDDELNVAVEKSLDDNTTRMIQRISGLNIKVIKATGESIRSLQSKLFGDLREAISLERPVIEAAIPATETTDASTDDAVEICDQILKSGILRQASDIHFNVIRSGEVQVRLRIDGELTDDMLLPASLRLPVCNRVKVLSGLDISEKRASQDGSFRYEPGQGLPTIEIRVATIPARFGERITLRLLTSEGGLLSLDSLGFTSHHRSLYEKAITLSHGMILITGPTGSGKSTSLYAGINFLLSKKEVNAMTVEDPIEYEIEGVTQTEVDAKREKVSFASSLRSILRHDPDVVMLGEIRDRETAELAVRASLTGHLVLSTLHTNTATGAVTRLSDLGVDSFLIASVLRLVAAQRLVRQLCPHCSQESAITAEEALALQNPALEGYPARKPGKCIHCAGRGYTGRTGLFEMLPIGPEEADVISGGAGTKSVENSLRSSSGNDAQFSLLSNGIEKIAAGDTTVEEVLKATLQYA
ncbi:MAG: GspE/PulE family protein [Verrucomicrobiota bacterium]